MPVRAPRIAVLEVLPPPRPRLDRTFDRPLGDDGLAAAFAAIALDESVGTLTSVAGVDTLLRPDADMPVESAGVPPPCVLTPPDPFVVRYCELGSALA